MKKERLQYKGIYYLKLDLGRVVIEGKVIYLGMNMNPDPPRHVILMRGRIFKDPETCEFVNYYIKKNFIFRTKKLILDLEEVDILYEDVNPTMLNDLEIDFAEKMYLQEAGI